MIGSGQAERSELGRLRERSSSLESRVRELEAELVEARKVVPGLSESMKDARRWLVESIETLSQGNTSQADLSAQASQYLSAMSDALKEISKTLIETMLIVAVVVFLFMGSVRTAMVPLVAMPVSLLGAAVVMLAFGFSFNLLTILAIVLSVGLVVDDAIVVVPPDAPTEEPHADLPYPAAPRRKLSVLWIAAAMALALMAVLAWYWRIAR